MRPSRILSLVQRIMRPGRTPDSFPIYILDDDEEFRSSLMALLRAYGHNVEEFSSVADFLPVVNSRQPGVLLLDLRMPKVSGLEFLEGHDSLRKFGIIIISGHGDVDAAVRAIQAGALGFIEKPFAAEALLAKIDAAIEAMKSRLASDLQGNEMRSRIQSLSTREKQILQAMLDGGSNKSIARQLHISVRTVEMHRSNMLNKLRVRSSAEAVHMATLAGLAQVK